MNLVVKTTTQYAFLQRRRVAVNTMIRVRALLVRSILLTSVSSKLAKLVELAERA